MRRTRGSLYYLAGYLYFGGAGFLLAPSMMLFVLMAEGIYSMVTLRLVGALMLSMAMVVTAVIEQSMVAMYRHMLRAPLPLLLSLAYVYYDSLDRMWAILLGVVLAGWIATLCCYLLDVKEARRQNS